MSTFKPEEHRRKESTHPSNHGEQSPVDNGTKRHTRGDAGINKANTDAAAPLADESKDKDDGEGEDTAGPRPGDDAAGDEDGDGAGTGGEQSTGGEQDSHREDEKAWGGYGGEAAEQGRERGQGDEVGGGEPGGVGGGAEVLGNGALDDGHSGHVGC